MIKQILLQGGLKNKSTEVSNIDNYTKKDKQVSFIYTV